MPDPTPTDADREAWIRLEPLIGNMLRIHELRKAFTHELIAAEARGAAHERDRCAAFACYYANGHRTIHTAAHLAGEQIRDHILWGTRPPSDYVPNFDARARASAGAPEPPASTPVPTPQTCASCGHTLRCHEEDSDFGQNFTAWCTGTPLQGDDECPCDGYVPPPVAPAPSGTQGGTP